ncbi:response regulator receiver protein [Thermobaculum terrenum ATCC BAA-798]|uniref:Response regulator receiver protein n=1 Tax=Thermobaculum terrenum (strain ATCC BAA-798 / CCMEE 7001 / YNP1) TaxID=525904 RepID=D1CEW9_THET1|nr:response regulator receiver protein [Thermobaculum terrenum ATCC BAA-798]
MVCSVAKGRILLVEDSLPTLLFLSDVLEDEGYEVKALSESSEVLKVVGEFMPDVIISDINMPAIDGVTLSSIVRRSFPDLPIILCSATRPKPRQQHILDKLQHCYFRIKPLCVQELLSLLEKLVE